jgi:hypothetical protein
MFKESQEHEINNLFCLKIWAFLFLFGNMKNLKEVKVFILLPTVLENGGLL